MKHLFTQLGTALILLFALNINAQSLVGLPEFGVTLSGTPAAPVLENHAAQAIIGHVLRVFYANSAIPVNVNGFKGREIWLNRGKGLQPNQSETPLAQFFRGRAQVNGVDLNTPVRVVLDSVVFADGHQIGPDVINNFDKLTRHIQEYKELAAIAHNARNNRELAASLWVMLDQMIAEKGMAQLLALDLRAAHNSADTESPYDIAERVLSIPTLWRTK